MNDARTLQVKTKVYGDLTKAIKKNALQHSFFIYRTII
jgi:hypothetical protein